MCTEQEERLGTPTYTLNARAETTMKEIYATTKERVVIPSSVCRKLGITEGTRIQIEVDEKENRIILTPITRARMQKLFGLYKGTDLLGAGQRQSYGTKAMTLASRTTPRQAQDWSRWQRRVNAASEARFIAERSRHRRTSRTRTDVRFERCFARDSSTVQDRARNDQVSVSVVRRRQR